MINQELLPVREFKIEENGKEFGDLDAISIVKDPAIEAEFQLFSKANINHFASAPIASEKMQITGPVMRPYKKMLRQDDDGNYFMGWFSESTIEQCMKNYMRRGMNRKANLEHEDDFYKDFYVFETWKIEDPSNDKANALGFTDLVKGDWFITYQCTSKEMWNKVKNGNYTGFSVEVLAAAFSKQITDEDIIAIINDNKLKDIEKEYLIYQLIK
jgi:hypothetical protein